MKVKASLPETYERMQENSNKQFEIQVIKIMSRYKCSGNSFNAVSNCATQLNVNKFEQSRAISIKVFILAF